MRLRQKLNDSVLRSDLFGHRLALSSKVYGTEFVFSAWAKTGS